MLSRPGRVGRFGAGRRAAAAVVEAQASAVDATGLIFTMVDTPASQDPDLPIAIERSGYNSAGVSTRWQETIRAQTRRVQAAAINSPFVGNEVMASEVVMDNDTFPNQAGLTNNSTRTPPGIEVRWLTHAGTVIGATSPELAVRVACPYNRNGSPAALVRFLLTDGTNTVSIDVTAATVRAGAVSGLSCEQWRAPAGTSIAALAEGRITVNFEVYGHYGQLIQSSALTIDNNLPAGSGTQYFRKHSTFQTPYAYVRLGSPGGAPVASTDPAVARAQPFGTLQLARDAARVLNRTQNGIGGAGTEGSDGIVIRVRGTGVRDIDLGTVTGAGYPYIAGMTIEPDPDDVIAGSYGGFVPRLTHSAMSLRVNGVTNPGNRAYFYFRNFDYLRSTGTDPFQANQANTVVYWVGKSDGNTFDFGTAGATGLVTNGQMIFERVTYVKTGTGNYLNSSATAGFGGAIDMLITGTGTGATLTGYNLAMVKGQNMGLSLPTIASPNQLAFFAESVYIENLLSTPYISAGQQNPLRSALFRNCVIVGLQGSEDNRFEFSSDAPAAYSLDGLFLLHCTIPAIARVNRANSFYADGTGASALRSHKNCGFRGSILCAIPSKGDMFGASGTPDAAREPGWREFGYGVGNDGNLLQNVWGDYRASNDTPRFYGRASVFDGNDAVFVGGEFVDPRLPTSGADGAYDGDYNSTAETAIPYKAGVQFDIIGRAVAAVTTKVGAYAGW